MQTFSHSILERVQNVLMQFSGVMMYRCLHGQVPRYLADHLIPASDAAPRRRLRSANLNRLTVPRCRLSTYGCRAFDYLPDSLELAAR